MNDLKSLRHTLRFAAPYLMLLTSGVIWGLTFSLGRFAALGRGHPVGLAFWQAIGGGLVLMLFCLLRGRRLKPSREKLKYALVIAILGPGVSAVLYFYAASRVPSGVLAVTIALVPMLTCALSSMFGIDRLNLGRCLGVLMGFIAIILLVAPDTSLPHPAMAPWLALPLIAVVLYSLENVYVDKYIPSHSDMAELLAGGFFIAAILLGVVMYIEDAFFPINLPLDTAERALLALVLVSSTAYAMFLYLVKMAGAVFASMNGYIITLAGVFWGMFFFSEQHSPWVWAALASMLLGMALVKPRHGALAGESQG